MKKSPRNLNSLKGKQNSLGLHLIITVFPKSIVVSLVIRHTHNGKVVFNRIRCFSRLHITRYIEIISRENMPFILSEHNIHLNFWSDFTNFKGVVVLSNVKRIQVQQHTNKKGTKPRVLYLYFTYGLSGEVKQFVMLPVLKHNANYQCKITIENPAHYSHARKYKRK